MTAVDVARYDRYDPVALDNDAFIIFFIITLLNIYLNANLKSVFATIGYLDCKKTDVVICRPVNDSQQLTLISLIA